MSENTTHHKDHHNVADNIHHLIQLINAKSAEIDALVSTSHSVAKDFAQYELQRIFDALEHVDKHQYAHQLDEFLKLLKAEFDAVEAEGAEAEDMDAKKYEYGTVKVAYYDAFPDPKHTNAFPPAHKY